MITRSVKFYTYGVFTLADGQLIQTNTLTRTEKLTPKNRRSMERAGECNIILLFEEVKRYAMSIEDFVENATEIKEED